MNNYQKRLLAQIKNNCEGTFIFSNCAPVGESCKDDKYVKYDAGTNCLRIIQDQDITKTIYELTISKERCPFIEAVQVKKDDVYIDVSLSKITVDFNDRIDAIKLKFSNNIADDLEIPIAYQEADKQAYEERQKALRKENLLKRASVKHAEGESLVNIYFQPCAENYDHTEISLFIPDEVEVDQLGAKKRVLSWAMIMKATVEKEMFFKSITGLAFGKYAYILKQFDKDNNLLVETNYIEFYVKKWPVNIVQGRVAVF